MSKYYFHLWEIVKISILIILTIFVVGVTLNPIAYGEMTYDEKLSSYQRLYEIDSHIVASEENYEKGNLKLAMMHLSHPIDEVYDHLFFNKIHNDDFSQKLELVLFILRNTSDEIDKDHFDTQIFAVREVLDEGKKIILSYPELDADRLDIESAIYLLNVAKTEYTHGLELNLPYDENLEHQDSYTQSEMAEKILKKLDSVHQKGELFSKYFLELDSAYDNSGTKEDIDIIINKILNEIDSIKINPINIAEKTEIISKDIPVWVKNIALWWSTGEVTDDEYIQSIEYLVSQGIITIKNK